MLTDEIKKRIVTAMKAQDAVARDILRLALSEIQAAETRKNAPASDEEAQAALRKLIKSNEETLGLTTDAAKADVLRQEVATLAALLPKQLTVAEIQAALESERDAIRQAASDGQATGIAMKRLKAQGASVSGADVTAAVKAIRA